MGEVRSPAAAAPTRVRHGVLAFLCVLALILYVDRLCISTAAPEICQDLGLTKEDMGWVFSAFTIAYCLFEVPTGAWGDRYGSRGVLTRIVLWWSAFTALTGVMSSYWLLLAVRFLFGAGEAGALPNTARILVRWFPANRRGPAQGLINTMTLIGAAATPPIAAYLIADLGWRSVFLLFALPGVVWAAAFFCWFRDSPAEHASVNALEKALLAGSGPTPGAAHHPPIPWRLVVRSPNVWLLGGVTSCTAFNTYLIFFWYPSYLREGRDINLQLAGLLAGMVLLGGAIGATLGGVLIDFLIRRTGDRRRSRRWLGSGALALSACFLVLGSWADSIWLSALLTAGAVFAVTVTLASWWAAVADISGRHLGALFGLMNSMGGVGAATSTPFVGRFVDRMARQGYQGREQWDPAFYVFAGVLLLGACGWLFIDSSKPIEPIHDGEPGA